MLEPDDFGKRDENGELKDPYSLRPLPRNIRFWTSKVFPLLELPSTPNADDVRKSVGKSCPPKSRETFGEDRGPRVFFFKNGKDIPTLPAEPAAGPFPELPRPPGPELKKKGWPEDPKEDPKEPPFDYYRAPPLNSDFKPFEADASGLLVAYDDPEAPGEPEFPPKENEKWKRQNRRKSYGLAGKQAKFQRHRNLYKTKGTTHKLWRESWRYNFPGIIRLHTGLTVGDNTYQPAVAMYQYKNLRAALEVLERRLEKGGDDAISDLFGTGEVGLDKVTGFSIVRVVPQLHLYMEDIELDTLPGAPPGMSREEYKTARNKLNAFYRRIFYWNERLSYLIALKKCHLIRREWNKARNRGVIAGNAFDKAWLTPWFVDDREDPPTYDFANQIKPVWPKP